MNLRLWFPKGAQDGRGIEPCASWVVVSLSLLAARIRALCAFKQDALLAACIRTLGGFRNIWLLAVMAVVLAPTLFGQVQRPYRGSIHWAVVLCEFSDSPAPPHDLSYYQQMITNAGTKGLADYIGSVSYGAANLSGSTVHGWYKESHTLADEQKAGRYQRLQDCLATAAADHSNPFTPPSGYRAYVITSPGVDEVGFEDCCSLVGDDVALPELAHEFGHGINLEHSFSNDPKYQNACWSQIGEYDNPWDLMSAANVFVDPTHEWGGGPPFLDAYHLDEMGWLPTSRVSTLGTNGILTGSVTLAALTHPEASGYLEARVPFDSNDPFHYYTVEYRTVDSWDAGIPQNIVLINEVKLNTNDSLYQTFLLRAAGTPATCQSCTPPLTHQCSYGDGAPTQSVNANGVTISIKSTTSTQATIAISTQLAIPCAQGYVWREATGFDRACVTPAIRTQTASDNAAAGSRHQPGSDTCLQGYVWRQSDPSDHVCVTTATRSQVQTQTAESYDHEDQTKVTYGPNTCKVGFVWRGIDDQDYVCVSYATSAQVKADNAAAGSRHVNGSDTCKQGYVWREAFPNDHVCVTGATRTQTQTDNSQGSSHILKSNS
jgi:hypothetical protein